MLKGSGDLTLWKRGSQTAVKGPSGQVVKCLPSETQSTGCRGCCAHILSPKRQTLFVVLCRDSSVLQVIAFNTLIALFALGRGILQLFLF